MANTLLNIETMLGSLSRLGATAPVRIGSVTLTGMEVPSGVTFGGQQQITIHRLPGGDRVIDLGGNDPNRIEMEGIFLGPSAQTRAEALAKIRRAGQLVRLQAAGMSIQVYVQAYRYTYEAKGAICRYFLVLELPGEAANSVAVSTSALSGLIGDDTTSALTSITSTVGTISQSVSNFAGQVQTVVGQVAPIANLIGAGGALAQVSDKLQIVQGAATAGTNLSALPSAASSVIGGLQSAGSGLMDLVTQTGQNLEGITLNNSTSLTALSQNAQLASTAVDAGGAVNRAAINAATATNAAIPSPALHG